ncbi:hypothetical protein Q5752_004684 [Cryptotrichosporon argae]
MLLSTLATLALVSTVLATPVPARNRWKRALPLIGPDYEIINLARNLESLELALWNQGLNNFTDDAFNSSGFAGLRPYIQYFRDQEIDHFTVIQEALGDNFTNCTYDFPIGSVSDLFTFGQVVTSVGEGAFIGALANLTNSEVRLVGGSILGNEARQNSKLREAAGLQYFNGVGLAGYGSFDTPLSASQAYSLAAPFLTGCPPSNPPINFKLIPPLNATFTNSSAPHQPGDAITITWNATQAYLGLDVHLNFIIGVAPYAIQTPLNQTAATFNGTGTGTAILPPGVNGTAFLVATNYQSPGAIPDNQNFAIGALVVA